MIRNGGTGPEQGKARNDGEFFDVVLVLLVPLSAIGCNWSGIGVGWEWNWSALVESVGLCKCVAEG